MSGLISAHSSVEDYSIITQGISNPPPGKYTLHVHVNLPYGYQDGTPAPDPSDPGSDIEDFAFPLTITKADPARLAASAEELRQTIAKVPTTDSIRRNALIKLLFSFPEEQGKSSWKELASDSGTSEGAAQELEHIHTPAAADILVDMCLQPSIMDHDGFVHQPGWEELAHMYNSANGALKEHIKHIFSVHGVEVGDTVHLPVHGG